MQEETPNGGELATAQMQGLVARPTLMFSMGTIVSKGWISCFREVAGAEGHQHPAGLTGLATKTQPPVRGERLNVRTTVERFRATARPLAKGPSGRP